MADDLKKIRFLRPESSTIGRGFSEALLRLGLPEPFRLPLLFANEVVLSSYDGASWFVAQIWVELARQCSERYRTNALRQLFVVS